MIEIRGLRKSFGSVRVLSDINLTIAAGRIYGLIGRSGAGKSTLLRCINGLEGYEAGSLCVDGVEVNSLSTRSAREFRKGIGMVFQQFSLLSRLTVYENIALPLRCWGYKKARIDGKVRELADMVGILDKLDARPNELSGGQKQRVAIARALSMEPRILLCDEATSALDPRTARSIISLLDGINRQLGITIVVVTHQMSVLRSVCEEISILEDGRIVESGPVGDVFMRQSGALANIIGEKDMILLETGVNLRLLVSGENSAKPVITQMARELQTDFVILGGETERYRDDILGSLIINVPHGVLSGVIRYLDTNGVAWKRIDSPDARRDEKGEERYA